MTLLGFVRRRIAEVVSGALNFPAFVTAGVRSSIVAVLRAASQVVGVRAEFAPATLLVEQRPGLRIEGAPAILLAAAQRSAYRADAGIATLIAADQRPALRALEAPPTLLITERPAANIVQITYDLSHTSHVVTAAVDAGATGTWNNPTRIQAEPQGTQAGSATFAGGLLLGTGKLRGTAMVGQLNRPASLAILEVYLQWHYQTSGLPIVSDLISQLALGYRVNTAPLPTTDADQAVVTSNDNFLVAGREIRIDNGAGAFNNLVSTPLTWANIALLQPYFGATTIANGLMTYYADAIRLRVVAREVQAV